MPGLGALRRRGVALASLLALLAAAQLCEASREGTEVGHLGPGVVLEPDVALELEEAESAELAAAQTTTQHPAAATTPVAATGTVQGPVTHSLTKEPIQAVVINARSEVVHERSTTAQPSAAPTAEPAVGSCEKYGCSASPSANQLCRCDAPCVANRTCCSDYAAVCAKPNNHTCGYFGCMDKYVKGQACQCNVKCLRYRDCCPDFQCRCSADMLRDLEAKNEKAKSGLSLALSVCLIGTVAFFSIVFYLVNSSNHVLRQTTWDVINGAVSIFCSCMLFFSCQKASCTLRQMNGLDHPGVALLLANFVATVVGLQCLLTALVDRPLQLAAWGTVAAHFAGFVGMDAFGTFASQPMFAGSPGWFLLGILASAAMLLALSALTSLCRKAIVQRAGPGSKLGAWDHECGHAENEFTGFILGLLASMLVRYYVGGDLPKLHGPPKGKTRDHVVQLCGISLASMLAVPLVSWALYRLQSVLGPGMRRWLDAVETVVAMTAGWLLLFSTSWYFWTVLVRPGNQVDKMVAAMCEAVLMSAFSFMWILLVALAAWLRGIQGEHYAIRGLNGVMVVGIGYSWESTIYVAVKNVEAISANPLTIRVGFYLSISLLVLPAWMLYMFKHSFREHGHGDGDPGDHGLGGPPHGLGGGAADGGAAGDDVGHGHGPKAEAGGPAAAGDSFEAAKQH